MRILAPLTSITLAAAVIACDRPAPQLARPAPPVAVRFTATRLVPVSPIETPKVVKTVRRTERAPAPIDWGDDASAEEATNGVTPLPWSLSESTFTSTVRSWSGIRSCVTAARATTGGALEVAFSIEGTGSVKRAEIVDTSNAIARSIAPCVERRAKYLSFPAFESGEEVTRIAKFVF